MLADIRAHVKEATVSVEAALVISEGQRGLEAVVLLLGATLEALEEVELPSSGAVVLEFPKAGASGG